MSDRPRARFLEAFPWTEGKEPRYALRDPEGLVPGLLLVTPPVLYLLRFLDGTRSRTEVARAWREATGEALPAADLDGVLDDLAAHLVLEGPAAEAERARALARYRARRARPAACAGGSYPRDPAACATYLDERIEAAGDVPVPARVAAVLAPHIDLRGGGPCHGAAARALARSPADVFVVIGTAHAGLSRPFALTTMDFETPRGTVRTDRRLVARLAERGGGGLLDDERAHEGEHSVEFQALWLAHLRRGRKAARIVPVLASSLHEHIAAGTSPRDDPRIADFVAALRELRDALGERVAFVASVDFAHVGPKYGGPRAIDDAAMDEVMAEDRRLLVHATAADAEGWLGFLHREQDRRNVCGAAPTYALLSVLEGTGLAGALLRHDHWEIDPDSGSRVSFAAVAYGR